MAVKNNYIDNEKYVNILYEDLAKKISEKFNTTYHSD